MRCPSRRKKQAFDELRPLARALTSALDAITDGYFVFPESAEGVPVKRSCGQMVQEKCRAPEGVL